MRISDWSSDVCSSDLLAEHLAMPRVVNGLHGRLAHQARRADHAIEPRERDHLQDGRNASTFLADAFSPGTKELDLARRVAPAAELVLATLDATGITRAVRSHLRHQKADQAQIGQEACREK